MIAGLIFGLLALGPGAPAGAAGDDGRWAAFVFAGRMTDNNWGEVVSDPADIDWSPVGLAGIGLSRRFADWRAWEFEIEGNAVKHFGHQHTWEVNVPVVARWTRFPWNDRVRTRAAFGIGLSWAENLPEWEDHKENGTEQVLTYWTIELEAGPPDSPWSGLARLHHRSTAYGVFGDSGGANSLVLGVRRRF